VDALVDCLNKNQLMEDYFKMVRKTIRVDFHQTAIGDALQRAKVLSVKELSNKYYSSLSNSVVAQLSSQLKSAASKSKNKVIKNKLLSAAKKA